jgi:hypothetical protein
MRELLEAQIRFLGHRREDRNAPQREIYRAGSGNRAPGLCLPLTAAWVKEMVGNGYDPPIDGKSEEHLSAMGRMRVTMSRPLSNRLLQPLLHLDAGVTRRLKSKLNLHPQSIA